MKSIDYKDKLTDNNKKNDTTIKANSKEIKASLEDLREERKRLEINIFETNETIKNLNKERNAINTRRIRKNILGHYLNNKRKKEYKEITFLLKKQEVIAKEQKLQVDEITEIIGDSNTKYLQSIDSQDLIKQLQAEKRKLDYEREQFEREKNIGNDYITWQIKESERQMVYDLLHGFEEYVKLKGYSVTLDIIGSEFEKVIFKFLIFGNRHKGKREHEKDKEKISVDFQEYIEKIRLNDDFDDMPIITTYEEHQKFVLLLRNRILLLQSNIMTKDNLITYQQSILDRLLIQPQSLNPTTINVNNTNAGNDVMKKNYSINNSPGSVQGDGISFSGSITIGQNNADKSEQIEKINDLILLVEREVPNKDKLHKACQALNEIRKELEEQDSPDIPKLNALFEKTVDTINTTSASIEIFNFLRETLSLFGIG